jgi:hypothetical protein
MLVLSSRTKALGAVLIAGVASFGITAAAITAASAQAEPSNPHPASTPATVVPTSVPELAIGPVSAVTSGQAISFPIDSYKVSPTSENLVLSAEYQSMKSCMARYGIDFAAPASDWSVPTVNHDYDRLFGVLDLAEAQNWGYHTGETLLPDGEAAPQATPAADPNAGTPNYLTVAMGSSTPATVNGLKVPSGGCIGQARAQVGDTGAAETLYENAVNYGLDQSNADPRVVAAFASWSTCMKAAGFSYATPMEAIDDPKWATTTPSATEVAVATSDVQCKVSTNLTGLRVAVASAWQEKYIGAHATQFAAMKAGVGQQVAKAKAILQQ